MENYLESASRQFDYYRSLGEKAIAQVPDDALFHQFNPESNSIATIVKHLSGNMLSRWTDFLTTDGEKETRNREAEFDNDLASRDEVLAYWNRGWECLFGTFSELKPEDLGRIVYIRNQGHTVMEVINRQLAHYPYHIGQIVFIGKLVLDRQWQSLSIPRGKSADYNAHKFAQPKHREHFTDEHRGN